MASLIQLQHSSPLCSKTRISHCMFFALVTKLPLLNGWDF
ncbi:hypothetical protein A3768_3029 [Ralstonia solanacearum]|nr:hypothetical protein F504_647 [Ralstonia pseudosolanacearum FQY_4]ANH34158.1 hypothetical protein A3768_3029 [Ralstonia solanacearum]